MSEITAGEPAPAPGMLKLIVCAPGAALASRTACRNEPGPPSLVLLTSNVVSATTGVHAANSDVLLSESVMVAEMNWPMGTVSVSVYWLLPETPVKCPTMRSPSPPVASQARLAKNCSVKPAAVGGRSAVTVVFGPGVFAAAVSTAGCWLLLPLPTRSMPWKLFAVIVLKRI